MPRVHNLGTEGGRDAMRRGAVYVGRPGPFGNQFVLGRDGDRAQVIEKYRQWLVTQPALVARVQRELAGKDLVCFCAPKACHGDVLLEVANAPAFDDGLAAGSRSTTVPPAAMRGTLR